MFVFVIFVFIFVFVFLSFFCLCFYFTSSYSSSMSSIYSCLAVWSNNEEHTTTLLMAVYIQEVIYKSEQPKMIRCHYLDASSTCMAGWLYLGAILTAVCCFDVVAPPISRGISKPCQIWIGTILLLISKQCFRVTCRSISLATCIISSKLGVIRPDRPKISAWIDISYHMCLCFIIDRFHLLLCHTL